MQMTNFFWLALRVFSLACVSELLQPSKFPFPCSTAACLTCSLRFLFFFPGVADIWARIISSFISSLFCVWVDSASLSVEGGSWWGERQVSSGLYLLTQRRQSVTEGPWWKAALQVSFCQWTDWLMFKLSVTIGYDGSSFRKVIFQGRRWQERRRSDFWGSLAEFHASVWCTAQSYLSYQLN